MQQLTQELGISIVNSGEPFPVNFDDAWKWVGYSRKSDAKELLEANFRKDSDFCGKTRKNKKRGRPPEEIYLTVDCFKSFCMMAGTQKGKEVRAYFLECERIAKQAMSIIPAQNERIRALELEADILRNRRWIIERKESLLALHGSHRAAWICDEQLIEVTEVVPTTVMVDENLRPIAQFDGVGIGYLTKRYGFRSNKETRDWLQSIGVSQGDWVQEMSAHAVAKLPRDFLPQLDAAWTNHQGSRQLLIGE